jgi:hypothetical protein
MTIEQFIQVAAAEPLLEIFLVSASLDLDDDLPKFSMAEGGPLCLQFQNTSVVLEQPRGRELISLTGGTINNWFAARPKDEDFHLALFSIFDLFCYRKTRFDPPPTINSITGYAQAIVRDGYSGLILGLSTGGIIGIDSSSDAGLRYFLDSQKAIFDRQYIGSGHFEKHDVWLRSTKI